MLETLPHEWREKRLWKHSHCSKWIASAFALEKNVLKCCGINGGIILMLILILLLKLILIIILTLILRLRLRLRLRLKHV